MTNKIIIECPESARADIILALGGSDFIEHFEIVPANVLERFSTTKRIEILLITITMKDLTVKGSEPIQEKCIVCGKPPDGKSNFCSQECHKQFTLHGTKLCL